MKVYTEKTQLTGRECANARSLSLAKRRRCRFSKSTIKTGVGCSESVCRAES